MNGLSAIATVIITPVVGLVMFGLVGAGINRWHQVSSFEGQDAVQMIMIALAGSGVSFFVSLIVIFSQAGRSPAAGMTRLLGFSSGIVLVLALLAGLVGWVSAGCPFHLAADPEPMDKGDVAAEQGQLAIRQRFAALGTSHSVQDLWPYIAPETPTEIRDDVFLRLAQDDRLVEGLRILATASDSRQRVAAMRIVAELNSTSPELRPVVEASGTLFVTEFLAASSKNPAPDLQSPEMVDLKELFSVWVRAADRLQQDHQFDFRPQLTEMAQCFQASDTPGMDSDLRDLAESYLRLWQARSE